jgi:hypothetical protein
MAGWSEQKHGVARKISHEDLRRLVRYDRNTGFFYARVASPGTPKGRRLGSFDCTTGYTLIGVYFDQYFAHRLAWFYVTGVWPDKYVDHKDRNKINNAWKNLRLATGSQNNANHPVRRDSQSGFKGVRFFEGRKKGWQAYIRIEKRYRSLGYFRSPEEAAAAYDVAALKLYGNFARLNFSEAA